MKKNEENKNLPVKVVEDPPEEYNQAFMVYTEIVQRRAEIARNFLELGKLFKKARDEKMYKHLDHDTFQSFLGSVGFRKSTVYSYIHIYELYIERLKLPPDFLTTIPYRMLQKINPVVEQNPEEWIYKAKELSESDLIIEIQLAQGKEVTKPPKPAPDKPQLFDFPNYLEFIKAYGCITCPEKAVESAHFPRTEKRGAPDHWRVPLCHKCHDLYHHDPIDFLISYRNQIFQFFFDILMSCYNLLRSKK